MDRKACLWGSKNKGYQACGSEVYRVVSIFCSVFDGTLLLITAASLLSIAEGARILTWFGSMVQKEKVFCGNAHLRETLKSDTFPDVWQAHDSDLHGSLRQVVIRGARK